MSSCGCLSTTTCATGIANNLQFCCRLFPSSIASRAHDTTQASEVQAPSLVWRWCRKTPCVAPRKCGCRSCRIVSSTRPAATDAIMRLLLLLGLVSTGGIADGNNAAGGCTGMPAARRSGRHTRQSVRLKHRPQNLKQIPIGIQRIYWKSLNQSAFVSNN